ncbi:MAG TPA: CHAT domain-containing protein [Cytophagaceae bacterium]|nr:CHAT domain-containing protein [Cytophagaceae bacterium]
MHVSISFRKVLYLIFFCSFSMSSYAQTQDEFMAKLSDVYVNASDKKKAMEIAKAMYKMVEQKKELQTYTNYFMLNQIFENQAPDPALAKACKEQSDKLLSAMTSGYTNTGGSSDAASEWNSVYYVALFSTTDPQNASKAEAFLEKNPSLQNFNNYTYIGYAYERNADFKKARENYLRAQNFKGNEKEIYHTYSYYTNFLSRSGDYLQAEEYIRKMTKLSEEAIDILKTSYKAEALTSKMIYYLSIGDYHNYTEAANEEYDYLASLPNSNATGCDLYASPRYTVTAYAREILKDFDAAEVLWSKRDSASYVWCNCINTKFPQSAKQLPLSMYPVFLIKKGKKAQLKKPVSFYIEETETYYNSFGQYADLSINFMRAEQLGFLGAPQYHTFFKSVNDQIINTKDFRSSTMPFASYAYFTMRDRKLEQSKATYEQLFKLNVTWINDIVFSFGEKAFVAYYNTKLKDGYDNYHSFVKIAKEKHSTLLPALSAQAYDNLLFTKSLSLKGTQKRKQAFLSSNDPSIKKLYDEWIEKKQELIRLYRKSEDPTGAVKNSISQEQVKKLQEEVNHLENELAIKAKDFKKYLRIDPVDWKTIRDQLKEGEAAVEMVRFQWRDQLYYSDTTYYAAYIITKTSPYPEVVYLPDFATDLENRYYKLYQNSIRFKVQDTTLYDHFWKPIKDNLKGAKKVYFSPDGIYHLINLSTFFNPHTRQYLLDEINIHYITSSTDVQQSPLSADVKQATLIGRPAYKTEEKQNTVTNIAMTDERTRSFVRDFRGNNITDLPGTETEVVNIKKEMDQHAIGVTLYLREQATEERIYSLHSPDVLHIATHGYWSEINHATTDGYRVFNAMVNSGLLLSGVVNYYSAAEYPDTYDGILTAYEAQNLDLENTSLVILSACETSLGHLDAGEGVYGLQRAFRAAGAKSIMTSLWKVDDEATKTFMISFYQNFLKTKDKFEAFRAAQKALKEKFPDPYYWGAFVLTGY